jgi:hypothetical protein
MALLRVVWLQLQEKHDIMHDEVKKKYRHGNGLDRWAQDCVDRLRVMCTHVVDLKKSGTTFLSPKLQALVALVKLPTADAPAPDAPQPAREERRQLRPQGSGASDASLTITHVVCRCAECMAMQPAIDVDHEADAAAPNLVEAPEDSDHSSTSMAAKENTAHVPAARGGQKKAIAAAQAALKKPAAADAPPEVLGAREADAPPARAAMKAMKAKKAMKLMKVVAAAAGPLKVTLQKRNTPNRKESIVLVNGKYMAQCSEKQSLRYVHVMEEIKEEVESGALKPEGEAIRTRILALI